MKNFLTFLLGLPLSAALLCAQTYDVPLEDLDESEVEQLDYARHHPLHINSASRTELLGSGLFTPLQVENLLEYRKRSGNILSLAELSLIDGFTAGEVALISQYVDVGVSPRAGKMHGEFLMRGGWKALDWNGAQAKFGLSIGDRASAHISARMLPSGGGMPLSGSVSLSPGPRLEKVVLGDYCLRFGQGLAAWSGMSLSSLSSISSFMRRPTGLKESHSLPPSGGGSASFHRGAAANIVLGRFSLIPFTYLGDNAAPSGGLHARYLSRSGEFGLTSRGAEMPLALDFRQYFRGLDLFGELLPFDKARGNGGGSFVAGTIWNMSYDSKLALRLGRIPMKESSVSAGLKLGGLLLTVDGRYLPPKGGGQCKLLLSLPLKLGDKWLMELRMKEKITGYEGTSLSDMRLDTSFSPSERWKTTMRLEASSENDLPGCGLLGYVEQGYMGERLTVWGRVTAWDIGSWDERIYVYERDAPQTFNMRAYYRRGVACSLYVSLRSARIGKLYLRLSGHDSRLQYSLSF